MWHLDQKVHNPLHVMLLGQNALHILEVQKLPAVAIYRQLQILEMLETFPTKLDILPLSGRQCVEHIKDFS